ncbi:AfsR/SARP family transcriptional regulator [Methyloterricola oryzae]|uniref:AfsR/SARP family transcriptional regulator n=1 Tax=Methyloterricola oryzae TaxID=1495050 RepID=UPI0005EB0817|nr:BTAD domain-containing putative transcriptional regulator [Methyloterricola oryzae]
MVRINLFGKIQVSGEDGNPIPVPGKALELLALVALNHQLGRDQAAGLLWEEAEACRGKKYLRNCLWQLRQSMSGDAPADALLAIGQDWLSIRNDTSAWVDTDQFAKVCADAAAVPPDGLTDTDFDAMKQGVTLYRGELLSGWCQEWCLIERERFQGMYFGLVEKLFDGCMARNRLDEGRSYGGLLLEAEPARESTHQRLMELHARAGDRSAALKQFQQCAQILEKEFGVEPCAKTIAFYEALCASSGEKSESRVPWETAQPAPDGEKLSDLIDNIATLGQALARLQGELEQIKQLLGENPATHLGPMPKSRKSPVARQRRVHN